MRAQTGQHGRSENKRESGFSLIELLIVVAVILVIAAIAIPNFIRSKMRANEASAVENLRTITTAETIYNTTYDAGYAPTLVSMAGTGAVPDATQAELIDDVLATGIKSGYAFTYAVVATDTNGHATAYSVNADPLVAGTTGDRHFYTDQSGIIRQNQSATAGPTDPALQ